METLFSKKSKFYLQQKKLTSEIHHDDFFGFFDQQGMDGMKEIERFSINLLIQKLGSRDLHGRSQASIYGGSTV